MVEERFYLVQEEANMRRCETQAKSVAQSALLYIPALPGRGLQVLV